MGNNYSNQRNENGNNTLSQTHNFNPNNPPHNISNIFSQSESVIIPRFESEPNVNFNQLVIEHQKSSKKKTYKNPIILLKSSLKLEKDSTKQNIHYIVFKYTSLLDFKVKINFNAILKNDEIMCNQSLPPIEICNLPKSDENTFFQKEAFIDIENYFIKHKDDIISDRGYFDVIIELLALKENGEVECVFASFCNLVPFKNDNNSSSNTFSSKIKCDLQKLKVKSCWFEMHSIFGLDPNIDSSSNDCEACCTRKKNTIFLPCKHSYACSGCSMVSRLPHNQCPLCRQIVTDCLIIDESKDSREIFQTRN